MYYFDTETHLIKDGCKAPKMVCTQYVHDDQEKPRVVLRDEGVEYTSKVIKSPEPLCGHNVFYDLGVQAVENPSDIVPIFEKFEKGQVFDTINRAKIMDNALGKLKFEWDEELNQYKRNPGYGMGSLVYKEFDEYRKKGEDSWRMHYGALDGVDPSQWPEDAYKYAARDATDTKRLFERYTERLDGDVVPGEAWENRANWALHLMGLWGARTEAEPVDRLEGQLTKLEAQHTQVAQDWGFVRPDGSRNMANIRFAIEKWYMERGVPMDLTEKGKVSTSRKQLAGTDHPGLLAVAEKVRVEKVLSTYIPILQKGTLNPICPSYNAIIETFRTSCRSPNFQNFPRGGDIRDCFAARPGWVYIFCDYDTLEMLTLGQLCLDLFGESKIVEAANNGVDFHLAVAAEMLSMPYSQALKLMREGNEHVKKYRQLSKIANYGFAGGMGAKIFVTYALGYGVTVSLQMAEQLRATFLRTWPEMRKYFRYCSQLCGGSTLASEKLGAHVEDARAAQVVFPRSGMVRGNVPYTAVCNGNFQHLAARGAKDALWKVAKECYVDRNSPLYGSRPWLFAHDEIGAEVPDDPEIAHKAAMRLQEIMVEQMKRWTPDVKVGAEVVMTRKWYKGAKPVFDKHGFLRPAVNAGGEWAIDA